MYKNLIAEMARNSLTQQDLCKMIGLNSSTLSDKINGKRDFRLSECKKISLILKSSIDYLFEVNK